ncbi:MAG: hypothetical protein PHD13_00655 [Methanocellales archaeon]|nr:hypothetical protein [Methanocellales archaeon]MDD3291434.1 hypothetical protein [Methanocellales archaeon]MDD5234676.1 hypothetical protein [Methanocellales archaeon]MDD5484972.1 hypothetical protein [Methanocellales archaeon]
MAIYNVTVYETIGITAKANAEVILSPFIVFMFFIFTTSYGILLMISYDLLKHALEIGKVVFPKRLLIIWILSLIFTIVSAFICYHKFGRAFFVEI